MPEVLPVKIHRDKSDKYIFEQGKVKFEIYDNLDQTLGGGRFIGEGPLDKLPESTFRQFASQNQLPTDPFMRDLLRKPLMRLLQREWYIAFEGQVPASVLNNDLKRMEEFFREFEAARHTRIEQSQKAKASGGKATAGRFKSAGPIVYLPTKNIPKDLKGQQGLISGWFSKHPAGGDVHQVTADLVAGGFTCNQDPERAIYYYLNEWKKKGWLSISSDGQPSELTDANVKQKKRDICLEIAQGHNTNVPKTVPDKAASGKKGKK